MAHPRAFLSFFFYLFAHPLVLFVVPVLIRLMEYRAAASVPLSPLSSMPARAERPGAQSHRRWGGEGAYVEGLRGS